MAITIRNRPGQDRGRGSGGRAGQDTRPGIQAQPGNRPGGAQGIAQCPVAADAGGQRQGGHGHAGEVGAGGDAGCSKPGGLISLHDHGEGQTRFIVGRAVGVRIRHRPGQAHGPLSPWGAGARGNGGGGRAGQGEAVQGQPGGNVADGEQGIAECPVAADAGRQHQVGNGEARDIDLRCHRGPAKIRHGVGQHGQNHGLAGRPGLTVPHHPCQRDGRGSRGRRAGQGSRLGVQDQPRGNVTDGEQGIAQGRRGGTARGGRQRQGRNGTTGDVGLLDRRRVEPRRIVVDHARHHAAGRDAAVAAHGVGDGEGLILVIAVLPGRHGDALCRVPGGGGEGQPPGDANVAVGRGDRRHGDRLGRLVVQPDGIEGGAAFGHDHGGRAEDDAGPGPGDAWPESGVTAIGVVGGLIDGEPGHTQRDHRRRGRGHAKRLAGALARGDGGDAGGGPLRPPDRHRQRGGFTETRPPTAIASLLHVNGQRERADSIVMQEE